MKTKLLIIAIGVTLGAWTPSFARNGGDRPPNDKTADEQNGQPQHARQHRHDRLPPEIKARVNAAREKALQDPEIQKLRKNARKANREFFKAMRQKMQEIDPGLHELLENARARTKGPESAHKGPGKPPGIGNLTDDERQKLKTARQTAKADPAVQAALEKKKSAKTPEERQTASEEYRKAIHEAMVKADSTIESILKKIGPKPPHNPPKPQDDGEMMAPQT